MIPTPQRVRANRLWSAGLALVVGACVAAGAWIASPGPAAVWITIAAAALTAGGLYRFGTRVWRRRRKVLARPLPRAWERILNERVAFYRALPDDRKRRFRRLVAIFLDETPIAATGCELDDPARVLIAAGAVIPILGLDDWEYGMLREVILRAGQFEARSRPTDRAEPLLGMVGSPGGAFTGALVLSRDDLLRGFAAADKSNVAIHEFAHLVDMADGAVDGVPASLPRRELRSWLDLVRREMQQGSADWSDIPAYAFTAEQEFFAVAAEYFFEAPAELAERHPELYEMLRRIFRQDPRGLSRGASPRPRGPKDPS